ncbi:uncharacterized protein [Amphiura filiformis]|uniref:uncharacterized protein n=1 Tax=Amphiura filiformis TaxID=82378 RepID=UPI003B21546D
MVSCPSCREHFPLPAGGVKNLKSNFLATKLIERWAIQRQLRTRDAKVPCTSCPEVVSPGIAVARCVECNDFLCTKCVDAHKSVKISRQHELLTLDQLRSSKLGFRNLPEQEICPKHKGEVLRFYCETCEEPMCRDCTVLDHPKPEHKQTDLSSAAKERNEKLKELAQNCEPVARTLDSAIDTNKKIKNDLDAAYNEALTLIRQFTNTVVDEVKRAGSEQEEELYQLKLYRDEEVKSRRDHHELMRTRIRTALDMAHQVTEKGSDHDVATMYSTLRDSMQELSNAKPKTVSKSLGKVTFVPREDFLAELITHKLGELETRKSTPKCVHNSTMCLIHMRRCRCVVFNEKGRIVVTDHHPNRSVVEVYKEYGMCRFWLEVKDAGDEPDEKTSQAWGVALGNGGQYFVTDLNPYIKVFNSQGDFYMKVIPQNEWPESDSESGPQPPPRSAMTSLTTAIAALAGFGYKQKPKLYGIAVDDQGLIYVGSDRCDINILKQDGSFISRFRTQICPYYIAVAHSGQIVLSDHQNQAVHVHDATGEFLNAFSIPDGMEDPTWFQPTGLCCTSDNEVYVANKSVFKGIFRYSVTGECLGVITKRLREPWGIALNEEEDKLAVVDGNVGGTMEIFRLS